MALVDHDEVEGFEGYARVVPHRQRAAARGGGLEERALLPVLVELLLALEHRVEALDGRYDHPARVVYAVGAQMLDVVLVGEGVPVVRAHVLLELRERLRPEVRSTRSWRSSRR